MTTATLAHARWSQEISPQRRALTDSPFVVEAWQPFDSSEPDVAAEAELADHLTLPLVFDVDAAGQYLALKKVKLRHLQAHSYAPISHVFYSREQAVAHARRMITEEMKARSFDTFEGVTIGMPDINRQQLLLDYLRAAAHHAPDDLKTSNAAEGELALEASASASPTYSDAVHRRLKVTIGLSAISFAATSFGLVLGVQWLGIAGVFTLFAGSLCAISWLERAEREHPSEA